MKRLKPVLSSKNLELSILIIWSFQMCGVFRVNK